MDLYSQENKKKLRVQRIAVIGNCGSEKTIFSKRLATMSNLPVYHLDDLFWNEDWTLTKPTAWKKKINDLVLQDKWIIDGTFESTLTIRLNQSDLIIFLDIPLWRCLWRVIVRDIKRYRGRQRDTLPLRIRNQPHKPKGGKGVITFWLYVISFPIRRRPKILNQLQNISYSKVTLRNNNEIEEWLDTFSSKAVDF